LRSSRVRLSRNQDILSYFSNPVSEFLLTYHSEFINVSEDSASGDLKLEGQLQVATGVVIRSTNQLHCPAHWHDVIASFGPGPLQRYAAVSAAGERV